jgi:class 3 adenylate cyclase
MTPVLRGTLALARTAVNVAGGVIAIAYLVLFAFEFMHAPNIERSAAFAAMRRLLSPSVAGVSHAFGWPWPRSGAFNAAPLILAVVAIFVRGFVEGLIARLEYTLGRTAAPPRRQLVPASAATGSVAPRYAGVVETEQQRAALLKRFRQIEDSLRSTERKACTFVSIDVVGSTKMKVDERPTAIAATFQAYEELVKQAFEAHGIWKSTWTPDGVMACFLDPELALRATQHVLDALESFNKQENQLRTPFKIRCGLNDGDVAIFDDSALEKISDHAIDIAGHMQKYAGENELLLSAEVYEKLGSPPGFTSTGRDVDGFATYAWSPQPKPTVPSSAGTG